jgi:hypothetical protein
MHRFTRNSVARVWLLVLFLPVPSALASTQAMAPGCVYIDDGNSLGLNYFGPGPCPLCPLPPSPLFPESKPLAVDEGDGKLYFGGRRSNLDGSGAETLNYGSASPTPICATSIAFDAAAGKIYWSDGGTVHRANLDLSSIETVIPSASGGCLALDLLHSEIYYQDRLNIARAHLDGSNPTPVVTASTLLDGIAVDQAGAKVYWTEGSNISTPDGRVRRANLDGSQVQDLLVARPLSPGTSSIAVDPAAGKMYWIEVPLSDPLCSGPCDLLRSADLDGSNLGTVLLGDFVEAFALCSPFDDGFSDAGFVPVANATVGKCESGVAKRLAKLVAKLISCHVARVNGKTSDVAGEDACKTAAIEEFTGKATPGCGGCTDPPSIAAAVKSFVDSNNDRIYCAAGTPFGGDDTGEIPAGASAAAVGKCENSVGKGVAKLAKKVIGCHIARVARKITGESDEENCEVLAITKFEDTKIAGCDPCMFLPSVGHRFHFLLDVHNDLAFCSSPSGAFLDKSSVF